MNSTNEASLPLPPDVNAKRPRRAARHPDPPKWLSYGIAVLVAFMLGYLACLPITKGGWFQVFTVEGQSMEPTYQVGDRIVAFKTDKYAVDDIVVYQSPVSFSGCDECLIVHRLVDRNDDGTWVIKGDNNPVNDPNWSINSSDLIGKVILNW